MSPSDDEDDISDEEGNGIGTFIAAASLNSLSLPLPLPLPLSHTLSFALDFSPLIPLPSFVTKQPSLFLRSSQNSWKCNFSSLGSERFYHNKNKIFFNKTCCCGPLLNPEQVKLLPDSTEPGKVATVIRTGLEKVAWCAKDPEKVMDMMQEGSGVRVVLKHKGKVLKKVSRNIFDVRFLTVQIIFLSQFWCMVIFSLGHFQGGFSP